MTRPEAVELVGSRRKGESHRGVNLTEVQVLEYRDR
jgi:hypothetical protein